MSYTFPAARRTPDELPYRADFTDWLEAEGGASIAAASVRLIHGDVEIDDDRVDFSDGKTVVFWVSGGTARYPVQKIGIEVVTDHDEPLTHEIVGLITVQH